MQPCRGPFGNTQESRSQAHPRNSSSVSRPPSWRNEGTCAVPCSTVSRETHCLSERTSKSNWVNRKTPEVQPCGCSPRKRPRKRTHVQQSRLRFSKACAPCPEQRGQDSAGRRPGCTLGAPRMHRLTSGL